MTSLLIVVTKVIDDVIGLRERFCGNDDVIKHRRDFDWLLEVVTKVTTNLLTLYVECDYYCLLYYTEQ